MTEMPTTPTAQPNHGRPTVTVPSPMLDGPRQGTIHRVAERLRVAIAHHGARVLARIAGTEQMVTAETHQRALQAEREHHLAMHEAFRPEAVAEIAVHLGSHEDWDHIAAWCGGRIENIEDACGSGEYSSQIVLPDGQAAFEQSWITLDHQGTFRVRHTVEGPEGLTA